jgi:hypothetical protein
MTEVFVIGNLDSTNMVRIVHPKTTKTAIRIICSVVHPHIIDVENIHITCASNDLKRE